MTRKTFVVEFRRVITARVVVEAKDRDEADSVADGYTVDDWNESEDDDVEIMEARPRDGEATHRVVDGKIVDLDGCADDDAPVVDMGDATIELDGLPPLERARALREAAAVLARGYDIERGRRARVLREEAAIEESRAEWLAGALRP